MPMVRRRDGCSADNATRRVLEKFGQHFQLRASASLRFNLAPRLLQHQLRFIQRFVAALDADDGIG